MAAADTARLIASLELRDQMSRGLADASRQVAGLDRKIAGLGKPLGFVKSAAASTFGFLGAQVASRVIGGGFSALKSAAIDMNASLETSTLQFETLMGNADKARDHVLSLFQFAARTPFETGPIIEASRIMQTFGGAALDTEKNLTAFGDAAAATSQPINEVAFWSSRLYSSLQAGKPFGEAAMRLGEMGILAPTVRNELEKMQKEGKSGPEIWAAYQAALGRFNGAMEKQADTWAGLTSSVSDNIKILGATSLKPIFDTAKVGMKEVLGFLSTPAATQGAKDFSKKLAAYVNPENMREVARAALDVGTNLLSFAKTIPWGALGASLKLAADSSRIVLGAFNTMPDWVKTAVLTGWGLNKLTGGALSGAISGLTGGVAKGVAGGLIGAGIGKAFVQPVFVTNMGVGGLGGAGAAGAAGAAGGLSGLAIGLIGGTIAAAIADAIEPLTTGAGQSIHDALGLPKISLDQMQWPFGPKNTPTILPEIFGGNGALGGTAAPESQVDVNVIKPVEVFGEVPQILKDMGARDQRLGEITGGKFDILSAHTSEAIDAVERARQSIVTKQEIANSRALHSTDVLEDIRAKRWSITNNIRLNVPVTTRTTTYRYTTTSLASAGEGSSTQKIL